MKKTIYILIFIISCYILYGWLRYDKDLTWFIINYAGSPLKLGTAFLFIITSLNLFVEELHQEIFRVLSFVLNHIKFAICLMILGGQYFRYGIQGTLMLSSLNPSFFDLPALPTVINFILFHYSINQQLKKDYKIQRILDAIIFANSSVASLSYPLNIHSWRYQFDYSHITGMAFLTSVFFMVLSGSRLFNDKYVQR